MHFCKPMKRHFMTTASANAATALSMAKEIHSKKGHCEDVTDLVKLIDAASLKLIKACERHALTSCNERESNVI